MNNLITIGTALLFLGIFLIFIGTFLEAGKAGKPESKVAVGGFIGFIPFGFANDKQFLYITIVLTIVLFLFFVFFNIWRFKP